MLSFGQQKETAEGELCSNVSKKFMSNNSKSTSTIFKRVWEILNSSMYTCVNMYTSFSPLTTLFPFSSTKPKDKTGLAEETEIGPLEAPVASLLFCEQTITFLLRFTSYCQICLWFVPFTGHLNIFLCHWVCRPNVISTHWVLRVLPALRAQQDCCRGDDWLWQQLKCRKSEQTGLGPGTAYLTVLICLKSGETDIMHYSLSGKSNEITFLTAPRPKNVMHKVILEVKWDWTTLIWTILSSLFLPAAPQSCPRTWDMIDNWGGYPL